MYISTVYGMWCLPEVSIRNFIRIFMQEKKKASACFVLFYVLLIRGYSTSQKTEHIDLSGFETVVVFLLKDSFTITNYQRIKHPIPGSLLTPSPSTAIIKKTQL